MQLCADAYQTGSFFEGFKTIFVPKSRKIAPISILNVSLRRDLADPSNYGEFMSAVTRLKNGKTPGADCLP